MLSTHLKILVELVLNSTRGGTCLPPRGLNFRLYSPKRTHLDCQFGAFKTFNTTFHLQQSNIFESLPAKVDFPKFKSRPESHILALFFLSLELLRPLSALALPFLFPHPVLVLFAQGERWTADWGYLFHTFNPPDREQACPTPGAQAPPHSSAAQPHHACVRLFTFYPLVPSIGVFCQH